MNQLSTLLIIAIAIVALAATLGASEILVRGAGRLARNLGLLGGVVGLVVALGTDAPEISSAVAAVLSGSPDAGVGVVFGSNIFNVAFLLGGSALVTGEIRVHREAVFIDVGVGIVVTLIVGAALLDVVSLAVAWVLLVMIFLPYVVLLALRPEAMRRLRIPVAIGDFLARASREADIEGEEVESALEDQGAQSAARSWRPVALIVPSLAVIVAGATLLVQGALILGSRWGVPEVLVGVVALAAATSLPDTYAAIRLAAQGHGAAAMGTTFNSNTLNLMAGIALPAIFIPSLTHSVPWAYLAWLIAINVVALILLARGLRRGGALVLLAVYAAFVTFAVVTS